MKSAAARTAIVFSVLVGTNAFAWKWRSSDSTEKSSASFALFFDCVQDARRAGYTVQLGDQAAESRRDGSSSCGLV